MAKFITFNGVTLVHPGGLTKIDAEGMAQVGGGVSGVVGVIGEADYGEPYDPATAADAGVEPKVYQFTDPQSMSNTFKSGPLADAVDFLFNPSNDVRIPGGVQRVIALKSNLDTKSSNTAGDISGGNAACKFTSKGYGAAANQLSVTTSINAADGNTIDMSITDGSTSTTETFTQICGDQLLDVQYAPSEPVVSLPASVTDKTTADGAASGLTLAWTNIALVTGLSAANEGQYVQITKSTDTVLVGQVRRIADAGYNSPANNLTVENPFVQGDGSTAQQVPVDTEFKIIKTAIGPFIVDSYDAATKKITTQGRNHLGAWNADSGFTLGSPTFQVAGVTPLAQYGDPQNGPCYVHIISGAGAGQIRRIVDATGVVATGGFGNTIEVTEDYGAAPATGSKFVLINAVPRNTGGTVDAPTATDGAGTGEGAFGIITGTASSGVATGLELHWRPGFGETNGAGTSVGLGAAGTAYKQWQIALHAGLNVSALVNGINLGTATSDVGGTTNGKQANTSVMTGQWKARVGPGRDGSLPTTRFDFYGDDVSNGPQDPPGPTNSDGVDCLCDFASTNPADNGTYDAIPNKYHRFTDNLMLMIDTINTQSALVSAARATVAGAAPISGTDFGDGLPAFGTYSLTGGETKKTTATSLRDCFDELIKHRHNTCVPLWSESTDEFTIDYVHSLAQTNVKRGAGVYKNEIDAIVGYRPPTIGAAGTALSSIKNYASTLNSRNVALVFQDIKRPGLDGKVNQYPPHMLGCVIAGMQAGSTVGTPLTYKLVRANSILCRDTKVDVLDRTTSDDLLLSGTLFAEFVKGIGYRIVRNLSTYTATDNLAYTDRHVNYELNYMAYDLRTFIEERFVGVKATPATVGSIRSAVISKLDYYKTNLEIIVDSQDSSGTVLNAYRNLKITISGDICTIRFEIFPTVGINYITFEIFAQLPTLSA